MAIPARKSADGFEMQFATNHLGHFALTGLLLDLLIETPGSRVVTVSSMMHVMGQIYFDDLNLEKKYTPYRAYGQSKLANVLFGFELQRRLEKAGANTISLVAHPGYAATNLQSNSADALGDASSKLVVSLGNRFMAQSQEKGALPQLYAATAPGVKGGEFYGPHFMGTRGYPKVAKANPKAYDTKVAAQLWAISEKLTGVEYNALKKAVTR
jgi:NAD(P)-dependent dehydrogenase (short-subunit alcohol dehydrogenase family)